MAEEFVRGAEAAGHSVELILLSGKEIGFCRGCLTCQKSGHCVIRDDALEITEKMEHADVLVFATPIYYYGMSGQMKTMLDRANPLYPKDYTFRTVYLLAAAAENNDHAWAGAAAGLEGWLECFPKAHFAGVVFAGGVTEPGDAEGHPSLARAFEAGRTC